MTLFCLCTDIYTWTFAEYMKTKTYLNGLLWLLPLKEIKYSRHSVLKCQYQPEKYFTALRK